MPVTKKLNVLLVRMPVIVNNYPAIALPCLFAAVKQNGYNVKTDDINIKVTNFSDTNALEAKYDSHEGQIAFFNEHKNYFESWVEDTINSNIDVLGFSIWETNRHITDLVCELIKQKKPEIKIIYGGPSTSHNRFYMLERKVADIVIRGEGEKTLLDVLDCFENNASLENVEGISFLGEDGIVKTTPRRHEIQNINTLPFLDFSDIDLASYLNNEIPLMFSRGCTWQCKFCETTNFWNKYRGRNAENVFNEILSRFKEFKREHYTFRLYDSAFNQNLQMLGRLCDKLISSDITKGNVSFGGWAKVMNGMDFDFIKKLRQAGLTNWSLGIESGSDKVLKLMGKPYTSAKAEEILKNGHELGIRQSFQIITGFPGETEEDWNETISFIERVSEYIIEVNFCYMTINHYTMHKYFKDHISPQLDINYGTQWSSIDGTNTPEVRIKRMERFEERILKSTDLLKRDPLHYAKSSL